MIYHPLLALSKIKGLTEVVIIGFYEDSLFADFIKQAKREFPGLSITYVLSASCLPPPSLMIYIYIYNHNGEVLWKRLEARELICDLCLLVSSFY